MRLVRPRFTILILMVVVAIAATVLSGIRPISQAEAAKFAEAKFLRIPGAGRWIGRYQVHARPAGKDHPNRYADGWAVVVSDPRDGFPLMQMFLGTNGKTRAVDFAPGKFHESTSAGLSVK